MSRYLCLAEDQLSGQRSTLVLEGIFTLALGFKLAARVTRM